ncbi:LuxR family transcriptional regulator [Microbacterium koreense]
MDAAAADLLRTLGAQTPIVLVIEDLHWAPSSTCTLVDSLARRLRRAPVLLIATVRTPSMDGSGDLTERTLTELSRVPGAQRIELAALADSAIREVITRAIGAPVEESQLADWSQRAAGNPLFARELAFGGSATGDASLPPTLADLFRVRLRSLPSAVVDVLTVTSCVGVAAHEDLIRGATDLTPEAFAATVSHAARARVVRHEGTRLTVAHPLLADAVTSASDTPRLRAAHAALARVLRDRPDLASARPDAEIAHHALRAGNDLVAFRACLAAADEAGTVLDFLAEWGHVRRAVELWPAAADTALDDEYSRAGLLVRCAIAAELAGRNRDAVDAAREALAASDDAIPEEVAERYAILIELLHRGFHDEAAAEDALRCATTLLSEAETPARARLEIVSGWWWDRAPEAACVHLRAGAKTAHSLGIVPLETQGWAMAGAATGVAGDPVGGRELLDRSVRLARDAGYDVGAITAHIPFSAMLTLTGEPEAAAQVAIAGIALTEYTATGTVLRDALRACAGHALLRSGDWEQAGRMLDAPFADEGRASALGLFDGAVLAALRGELDRARALLARAESLGAGDTPGYGVAAAWTHIAAGDVPEASRVARRVLRDGEGGDAATVNELVLLALAELPGAVETEEILRRLQPDPGGIAVAEPFAKAARAAVRDMPDEWARAREAWETVAGWPLARLYLAARHAGALGVDDPAAHLILDEALTAASALDAPALVTLLTRAAGRPERPDARPSLTPREWEVLELVAEGATNRVIGSTLDISERTASVHVSNLMRKLGVASRTEAALWAAQRD